VVKWEQANLMSNGKPVIEIINLSKHFGKLRAVDNITLSVDEGEVFALLGPNGAGKTTTVSMLCGLLVPTKGTASVAGFDVKKLEDFPSYRTIRKNFLAARNQANVVNEDGKFRITGLALDEGALTEVRQDGVRGIVRYLNANNLCDRGTIDRFLDEQGLFLHPDVSVCSKPLSDRPGHECLSRSFWRFSCL